MNGASTESLTSTLRGSRIVHWSVRQGEASFAASGHGSGAEPGEGALRAWASSPDVVRDIAVLASRDHDGGGRLWETLGGVIPAVSTAFGAVVVAALPEGFERSELFGSQCRSASMDPEKIRSDVSLWAVHPTDETSRMLELAAFAVEAQQLVQQSKSALAGYTSELSSCYETLDFLFDQGKQFERIGEPDRVLREVCEGMCGPVAVTWSAIWVPEESKCGTLVSGRVFQGGRPPLDEASIRSLAASLSERGDCKRRTRIIPASGYDTARSAGLTELIARNISLAEGAGAVLLAGADASTRLTSYETQLCEASAGWVRGFLEVQRLWNAEQSHVTHTLEALTRAIDAKDPYTSGHSERVACLSRAIAVAAGLGATVGQRAYVAGLVHDIGKIGVPEEVLRKPAKLTDEEFELIKLHPEIGMRILERLGMLEDVLPAVLGHHERWDGRGYPRGLAGESIDRYARIVGIADTFDAMSSNRAYRSSRPRGEVLAEVSRCAGTQFDPELVRAFERVDLSEYDALLDAAASGESSRGGGSIAA